MRRAILIAGLTAALVVPVALAANGDPQRKPTKVDQAHARAASLRLSDFGAGWKAVASANKADSNPRCSAYNPDQSDLIETGKYKSPDFTRSDGSFVSVSTGVFKTAAMARAGYARVAVPALPGCFGELFRKGVTKPDSATITYAGPLTFPPAGDRSNAYRISLTVKTPSARVPATIDMFLFNKGRTDVAVIALGIAKPLPSSFEQQAVARVLGRVKV